MVETIKPITDVGVFRSNLPTRQSRAPQVNLGTALKRGFQTIDQMAQEDVATDKANTIESLKIKLIEFTRPDLDRIINENRNSPLVIEAAASTATQAKINELLKSEGLEDDIVAINELAKIALRQKNDAQTARNQLVPVKQENDLAAVLHGKSNEITSIITRNPGSPTNVQGVLDVFDSVKEHMTHIGKTSRIGLGRRIQMQERFVANGSTDLARSLINKATTEADLGAIEGIDRIWKNVNSAQNTSLEASITSKREGLQKEADRKLLSENQAILTQTNALWNVMDHGKIPAVKFDEIIKAVKATIKGGGSQATAAKHIAELTVLEYFNELDMKSLTKNANAESPSDKAVSEIKSLVKKMESIIPEWTRDKTYTTLELAAFDRGLKKLRVLETKTENQNALKKNEAESASNAAVITAERDYASVMENLLPVIGKKDIGEGKRALSDIRARLPKDVNGLSVVSDKMDSADRKVAIAESYEAYNVDVSVMKPAELSALKAQLVEEGINGLEPKFAAQQLARKFQEWDNIVETNKANRVPPESRTAKQKTLIGQGIMDIDAADFGFQGTNGMTFGQMLSDPKRGPEAMSAAINMMKRDSVIIPNFGDILFKHMKSNDPRQSFAAMQSAHLMSLSSVKDIYAVSQDEQLMKGTKVYRNFIRKGVSVEQAHEILQKRFDGIKTKSVEERIEETSNYTRHEIVSAILADARNGFFRGVFIKQASDVTDEMVRTMRINLSFQEAQVAGFGAIPDAILGFADRAVAGMFGKTTFNKTEKELRLENALYDLSGSFGTTTVGTGSSILGQNVEMIHNYPIERELGAPEGAQVIDKKYGSVAEEITATWLIDTADKWNHGKGVSEDIVAQVFDADNLESGASSFEYWTDRRELRSEGGGRVYGMRFSLEGVHYTAFGFTPKWEGSENQVRYDRDIKIRSNESKITKAAEAEGKAIIQENDQRIIASGVDLEGGEKENKSKLKRSAKRVTPTTEKPTSGRKKDPKDERTFGEGE